MEVLWGKAARMTGVVLSALSLGLAGLLGSATPASAAGTFSVVQTFVKSGPVHSPTFISARSGWAVVGNRLLHTDDGGARWNITVPAEWGGKLPEAIAFSDALHGWAVGDHFAFATTDGGHSWTLMTAETPASHLWLAAWALDAQHVVLGAADGTIAQTADGGATWCVSDVGGVARVSAFWFTGASTGFAAAADASGNGVLLATSDAGASWQVRAQADGALDSVTFADALHGWVAGAGALLRTTDGGASWVALASPLPKGDSSMARTSIAFTSDSHGFLGVSGGSAPLYETPDGGVSWNAVSPATEPAQVYGLIGLGSSSVLVLGQSTEPGTELPTARVWSWTQAQSVAAPASAAATNSGRTITASATKHVSAHGAKKRGRRKTARHHKRR
jgi:photosystem II stability/assembly factor-like uncharacterized protein